MDVKEAIEKRRAYRSLEPVEITDLLLDELARAASLAPSCFNNQPWRFVFVRDPEILKQMHGTLSPGNEWVQKAPLIIAIFSKKEQDCAMKDGREYFLFDTGIAVGFIVLRATELGLVAHPIAGYSEIKAKQVLGIPDEFRLITLINVGKHSEFINPVMSEKQVADEKKRPDRKPVHEWAYLDKYGSEWPK
jgi:nitroreductase